MITSGQQLKSVQETISRFAESIEEVKRQQAEGKIPANDAEISIGGFNYEIKKLKQQVDEYKSLISGSMDYIDARKLEDLPRTMIQLRLALGWSQKRLADELGVQQQQIARYEATDYEGISFQRMLVMLNAFDAHISIEKIRMTIDGKSQTKFLLPKGYKPEDIVRKKRMGLFNLSKAAS
ncbi:unnamed protein product [Sphagnum jensenii]|uniref:HTH cro/C1-type domain-containing protein n=1 Tax=Sphagnum jensenii TaxID=128206 RepID=A0ABP0VDK6_9BRYO